MQILLDIMCWILYNNQVAYKTTKVEKQSTNYIFGRGGISPLGKFCQSSNARCVRRFTTAT